MIRLPKDVNLSELLKIIRRLGWDVSEILRSYNQNIKNSQEFQKKLKIINHKTGPVTAADIEISNLIKNRIKESFPTTDWDFLSEEDIKDHKKKKFTSKWLWLIDPLDGTRDFIGQTGEYAVHLALLYEKVAILSIVPIPSLDQLWIYQEGKGTWRESQEKVFEISNKPIIRSLDQLTILTSKSHMHSEFKMLLEKLKPKEVIGMGSVGYKINSILKGFGDVYISYSLPNKTCPKDWDIVAPLSLIKGAGGKFTDMYGKELSFMQNNSFEQGGILVASFTQNHQDICKQISNIVKINSLHV